MPNGKCYPVPDVDLWCIETDVKEMKALFQTHVFNAQNLQHMKTVLVTGANKSIGYETVRLLAEKGYRVYLGSRDLNNGKEAAARLNEDGTKQIIPVQLDVTDPASVMQAKAFIAKDAGTLDILINNAGILGEFPQTAVSSPVENLRKVFDTNFFGVITVTQTFLELMYDSKRPVIVNVTSGLASLTLHNDPSWVYYSYKIAGYGPSKSALNAYTIALAYELKDKGFKVNVVDPGHTATDFNHHTGTGSVADAADFVAGYAVMEADGPTGMFFSKDIAAADRVSPW